MVSSFMRSLLLCYCVLTKASSEFLPADARVSSSTRGRSREFQRGRMRKFAREEVASRQVNIDLYLASWWCWVGALMYPDLAIR